MRFLKRFGIVTLLSGICLAQTQAPATPDELKYFHFMLMNLASLDHSSTSVSAYESSLVLQFGLNSQEAA
jgi:hypothetical protein